MGGAISGGIGILVMWYSLRRRSSDDTRDSIYVPLYDSIMNLRLEPVFDEYAEHTWGRLEDHKKIRTDKKIRDLYEKYEKLGWEHHYLLVEWENEFNRKISDLLLSIKDVCDSVGVSKEDRLAIKTSYNIEIKSFLNWFRHVLFDKTIKNHEELYEKLLKYSNDRQMYRDFPDWLKQTYTEKPNFYVKLFEKTNEITKSFPESIDYFKLVETRNKLKELIIEIRKELKKRV